MRRRRGDIEWIVFTIPPGFVLSREGHAVPLEVLQELSHVFAFTIAEAYERAGRQWPGIRLVVRSRVSCALDSPAFSTLSRSVRMTPAGMHQVRLFAQTNAGEDFFDRTGGAALITAYAAPFERGEMHCVVATDRFAKDEEIAESLRTLADRLHPVEDVALAQLLRGRAEQGETPSELAEALQDLATRLEVTTPAPASTGSTDGS